MAIPEEILIIECPTCEAKVSARVIAIKDGSEDRGAPTQILFMECLSCKGVLLGHTEMVQVSEDGWDYCRPDRLWPKPKNSISWKLPDLVRESLEEASLCFNARAYSATVVMCGRALESICKDHSVKDWKLSTGLKELKSKGIIDGRLFEWGEELRKSRNLSAHASDVKMTSEDSRDILDFTIAIGEYVYVLADKYASFKERQSNLKRVNTASR
jgi:uncharacterized protein DUF4145